MTLTQVAIITRRGIIIFFALIVLSIVGAVGYRVWYNYYLSTLPPVEEKPDLKFGALPKINFSNSTISSANYSYSIDTETGFLPQMPKIIKVYFIPRASTVSLMDPDESQKLAQSFGFNSEREVISPFVYKYSNSSGGSFIIDLTTRNFDYQQKTATSSGKPDKDFANSTVLINNFKNFLSGKGLLNSDLSAGKTNVLYNKSTPANSTSAQVSIWPGDFDGLPIITSSFKTALVTATNLNTENEPEKYPEMSYIYWQIDKNTFATYYLKSSDKAFSELQSGLGFVVLESPTSHVSITKAYLAYFESEEYTPYLQPVYVFEGPDFKALVPAVNQD